MDLDVSQIQNDLQALVQRRQKVQQLFRNFQRGGFRPTDDHPRLQTFRRSEASLKGHVDSKAGPEELGSQAPNRNFRNSNGAKFNLRPKSAVKSSANFRNGDRGLVLKRNLSQDRFKDYDHDRQEEANGRQVLKSKVSLQEEQRNKKVQSRIVVNNSQDGFEEKLEIGGQLTEAGGKRKHQNCEEDLENQSNSKKRTKRLFGSLLGTLQQFRKEEAIEKQQNTQRKALQELANQRYQEKQEQLQLELKIEKLLQRKEELSTIREVNSEAQIKQIQLYFAKQFLEIQEKDSQFLKTSRGPILYWLPKMHNEQSFQQLEKQVAQLNNTKNDYISQMEKDIKAASIEAENQTSAINIQDITSMEMATEIENLISAQFKQERRSFYFDHVKFQFQDLETQLQDQDPLDQIGKANTNDNIVNQDKNLDMMPTIKCSTELEAGLGNNEQNLDPIIQNLQQSNIKIEEEQTYQVEDAPIHPAEFLLQSDKEVTQKKGNLRNRLGKFREDDYQESAKARKYDRLNFEGQRAYRKDSPKRPFHRDSNQADVAQIYSDNKLDRNYNQYSKGDRDLQYDFNERSTRNRQRDGSGYDRYHKGEFDHDRDRDRDRERERSRGRNQQHYREQELDRDLERQMRERNSRLHQEDQNLHEEQKIVSERQEEDQSAQSSSQGTQGSPIKKYDSGKNTQGGQGKKDSKVPQRALQQELQNTQVQQNNKNRTKHKDYHSKSSRHRHYHQRADRSDDSDKEQARSYYNQKQKQAEDLELSRNHKKRKLRKDVARPQVTDQRLEDQQANPGPTDFINQSKDKRGGGIIENNLYNSEEDEEIEL